MELIRQRLNEIKNTEDSLRAKVYDLETGIRFTRDETDKILFEVHELEYKKKLMETKCEKQAKRLEEVLKDLTSHTVHTEKTARNLDDLNSINENQFTQKDELEEKLTELKKTVGDSQIQCHQATMHLKHVEKAAENAVKRAEEAEHKLRVLEEQHSSMSEAFQSAESNANSNFENSDLESQIKELQDRIELVTAECEASKRSVNSLELKIDTCRAELQKQQETNYNLKKEIESLVNDVLDM